jgi:hypothetical protein
MWFFSSPFRQEALLAAISEKDANIALLELSSSKKKTQEEVAALKREKDRLVQQLKQQVLGVPKDSRDRPKRPSPQPFQTCLPFQRCFSTLCFMTDIKYKIFS